MKFKVPVPGKFVFNPMYGNSYYALNKKHGELCSVGIDASERITRQYDFEFDEETAKEFEIDKLPREEVI
ncbi:hypothetical protein [Companilactobacillus nodensis]|uniref:Uncharacterized protein n=1 Tax=Companilactobacillus nodensis DSM 19682 = JCM 14932 = NBRC 107160 TaxID=1423775 RepID=A0A0R1KF16_9LACO|nr:hypothetical protein [Companilactobacillus nodensis]KRK79481.1 hypothetical protein FD03_GL000611 [Companilactobacillus nodensis DSM 19682 = JCM 14932 = NBRC 107160]